MVALVGLLWLAERMPAASGEPPAAERQRGGEPLRYLALGDSYTIGEAVAAPDRWPEQLARLLRQRGVELAPPQIVARTGWTVAELAAGIDAAAPHGRFDLVSLLIGVNDQYRGHAAESYRRELAAILRRAAGFAGGRAGRLLVLSIPDWSVTPFARDSGREPRQIAGELVRFNQICREEAERLGARYVDITAISQRAVSDRSLLAGDGLHPAAAMYAEWARLALPEAAAALAAP